MFQVSLKTHLEERRKVCLLLGESVVERTLGLFVVQALSD